MKKVMLKRYLLLISLMLPLLFSAEWAKADSERVWLIKTKASGTVYTLWLDGQVTTSDPKPAKTKKPKKEKKKKK